MTPALRRRIAGTRGENERDRALPVEDGGDGFPPGLTPEEIGGEILDIQGWGHLEEQS